MPQGIGKTILSKINKKLISSVQLNQWKNSPAVIKWFKNIQNKNNYSYIVFNIENLYPPFFKEICDIQDDNILIIMHARNTSLFSNGEPWVKKDGKEDFDVQMGYYDGADICELIGRYLLYQINNEISKENIGLFRETD